VFLTLTLALGPSLTLSPNPSPTTKPASSHKHLFKPAESANGQCGPLAALREAACAARIVKYAPPIALINAGSRYISKQQAHAPPPACTKCPSRRIKFRSFTAACPSYLYKYNCLHRRRIHTTSIIRHAPASTRKSFIIDRRRLNSYRSARRPVWHIATCLNNKIQAPYLAYRPHMPPPSD